MPCIFFTKAPFFIKNRQIVSVFLHDFSETKISRSKSVLILLYKQKLSHSGNIDLFSDIMNHLSKALLFLGFTAISSTYAGTPQFPFPQNKAYPYGNTFQSASTDKILAHFTTWKQAWYTEAGTFYEKYEGASENANASMPNGTARIISPNAHSELTVSEGIAYGMLLMVYMSNTSADYQTEFDKLWKYWKCYGKGLNGNGCSSWNGQGMDWQIDNNTNDISGGSASDADFDAALALIMASKQWNNATYLNEAKQLIAWIKANDMESDGSIRPGSNWNEAFNPSYSCVAAFELFYQVTNDSFWKTAISTTMSHLRKCQHTATGLMPDWCDWNSHKPTQTNASVSGGYLGFYDDAARTPWRTAWGYAWYGISQAKEANDAIIGWLDSTTYGYAGMILPGYSIDGTSDQSIFVSSTYTGGLGLSMLSSDKPKSYLENLYYTLIHTDGKTSLTASNGENYFAATLNILYLLTLTGNLPNFYDMTGFTNFTPNPANVLTPKEPEGTLQPKNAGAAISGFTEWGAYSDKFTSPTLGTTKMFPDSGSSAIYQQADGSYNIAMEAFIASEPPYEGGGEKYPFAGVACSFDSEQGYHDLSDLDHIRITYKSQGVMRFALLDKETLNQDKEGAEPGIYLPPTEDWRTIDIDITYNSNLDFNTLRFADWSNLNGVISATDVLKAVRGVKFDVKMQKAGYASFALKEINLFDKNGKVVSALNGTNPIHAPKISTPKTLLNQENNVVFYQAASNAKLSVFDLNGTLLSAKPVQGVGQISLAELVPAKGQYILRLTSNGRSQFLKVHR